MALRAALGLGIVIGCAVFVASSPSEPVKSEKEPRVAPEFALKDADGKTVRLSDYRGKVVLLDFWATWCGPCKIEIPWFMEFERNYRDRGFAVLGVSMDEEGWDAVKPFVTDMAVNYRMVLGDDTIAEAYGGVEALPTTFLIDREGKIVAAHVGLTSKSEIQNGIEKLLQPPAAAGRSTDDGVRRRTD